jgi:L-threonylcarbamoyladenylate synthase
VTFNTQTGIDIEFAATFLKKGETVAIPTETVYGLAANGLNPDAVLKIFSVKNRPHFDPLILHIPQVEALQHYVSEIPPLALALANKFWPGPLTLLLPKKTIVPDLVTSGLDTVAVRVPNHPLTLQLLQKLDFPLAAPSANPFGYISPTTAQHVYNQLQGKIPYILDGGACNVGVESTIIGFENNTPVIYRLGGLAVEEIEAITGPVKVMLNTGSNPKTPGMLKSHYAPRKKLVFGRIEDLISEYAVQNPAVISLDKSFTGVSHQIQLSPLGDLHEAAKNLFAAMRQLDESEAGIILADVFPDTSLGKAINDRLQRAAAD